MSDTDMPRSGRPITGRTVLAICLGAFAVVLAANLTLLFSATGTFPGLVVKNSYVAGVGWDARAEAQRALGWQTVVAYRDGALALSVTGPDGAGVEGLAPELVVGRPATSAEDRRLSATAGAEPGRYAAAVELAPGLWRVAIATTAADGRRYAATAELYVPEPR